MADITIYIEAMGIAEDENGNPTFGSMKIKLGEYKPGMELAYSICCGADNRRSFK